MLSKYIFIQADYALSMLETIFHLMGYKSVLSNSNFPMKATGSWLSQNEQRKKMASLTAAVVTVVAASVAAASAVVAVVVGGVLCSSS